MAILLVIDMQPSRFKAARHPWMVRNVSREIQRARKLGWHIAFVEYTRGRRLGGVFLADRTDPKLTGLVDDYDKAMTIHKYDDDGHDDILNAIDRNDDYGDCCSGIIDGGIRVVGVNSEGCVAKTVDGLSRKRKVRITVIGDACNGESLRRGGSRQPDGAGLLENIRKKSPKGVRVMMPVIGDMRVVMPGMWPAQQRAARRIDRASSSCPSA